MRYIISLVIGCILFVAIGLAGDLARKRSSLEFQTASMMALHIGFYWDANHQTLPISLTNVFQSGSSDEFLLRWEKQFDEFGTNRGFESNLLEKYVLLNPPLMMASADMGYLVAIAHEPYMNENGELWRAAVKYITPGDFRGFTYKEEQVQEWLKAAGRPIPEPEKLEPIPRPPKQPTLADMSEGELERLFSTNPPAEKRTGGLFSNPLTTSDGKEAPGVATNAVLATTETPSAPTRWWLPVAVIVGLGVIGFLILRARRRA